MNGELVEEAIDLAFDGAGADDIRVGGMNPAGRNRTIERMLDRWFEVATEYGVELDIHLQYGGAAGTYLLEEFLDHVESLDYEERETVSHGFCFGHISEWQSEGLVDRLVELDVGNVRDGTLSLEVTTMLPMLEEMAGSPLENNFDAICS
ncbi:hypothetical protein [Natronosalvus rutilus]|uniref:Uncharacterized protein n=1 Tax=Natronosalvus rutilus TaxID=2953753 RepID=A0A9E7SY41_9EURY|nr:hypothetical protein [Natronosalvus rutilus]UTF55691.1 hypothetical protein NGM29_18530 [Natronosalvus rutilus]